MRQAKLEDSAQLNAKYHQRNIKILQNSLTHSGLTESVRIVEL